MSSAERARTGSPVPAESARESMMARVISVVVSAVTAAFGLWLGLAALGEAAAIPLGTLLAATVALFVVEVASRPWLRGLASRGSAVLALGIGLTGQVVIAALVVSFFTGVRFEAWYEIAAVLGITALVTASGRWLVGASDAAYVVGHALRHAPRHPGTGGAPPRGLVILQFDGVSAEVMRRAMASGQAPTVSRWLNRGSHVLRDWWVPVPSTTPASQAGLLHGNNTQVVGFRWWDRKLGRLMVSNRPADAAIVEARLGVGRGLLREGGEAMSTAFSGEAKHSYLVFSQAVSLGGLGSGAAYVPLFANPFLLPRTVLLTAGEMLKEVFQARRQKVRGVEPRVARKFSYVALRGLTNVFLRTTNMVLVTDAMSRGAPVIFADFVDYDEIAHHAGPERPEAMRALEGMDAVLGELARAAGRVATNYDFVVWSDHGQSLGSTFRQMYGATLAQRVDELMGEDALHTLESANGDDWGPLNALLASTLSRVTRRASRFEVGPDRGQGRPLVGERPGAVVVGGGNLGMVWFPVLPFRPTLVELDGRWPGLVPGLALTPGIGAVMVAGEDGSTMVVGKQGVRRLDDGRCDGSDPLTPYGPRAAADLLHLAGLEHCGDLVLLST
ncbi:MAG: alkaline phosphatase family protein, partial [Dermatophilaceae bacterium]